MMSNRKKSSSLIIIFGILCIISTNIIAPNPQTCINVKNFADCIEKNCIFNFQQPYSSSPSSCLTMEQIPRKFEEPLPEFSSSEIISLENTCDEDNECMLISATQRWKCCYETSCDLYNNVNRKNINYWAAINIQTFDDNRLALCDTFYKNQDLRCKREMDDNRKCFDKMVRYSKAEDTLKGKSAILADGTVIRTKCTQSSSGKKSDTSILSNKMCSIVLDGEDTWFSFLLNLGAKIFFVIFLLSAGGIFTTLGIFGIGIVVLCIVDKRIQQSRKGNLKNEFGLVNKGKGSGIEKESLLEKEMKDQQILKGHEEDFEDEFKKGALEEISESNEIEEKEEKIENNEEITGQKIVEAQ